MNNVKMLHRIFFERDTIKDIYDSRKVGLAYSYREVVDFIDKALNDGYKLGSLQQALIDPSVIHLTFDDGYKEHLAVAKRLKAKYSLQRNSLTFCINVNNCTKTTKICTDVFYYLFSKGEMLFVEEQLKNIGLSIAGEDFFDCFEVIKKHIFNNKNQDTLHLFERLSNYCQEIGCELPFLDKAEVVELSQYFSIASHALHHFNLTSLEDREKVYEMSHSKTTLQQLTNTQIDIFCYPDGACDDRLQKYCQDAGYSYALAIKENENSNNFCVPRDLSLN